MEIAFRLTVAVLATILLTFAVFASLISMPSSLVGRDSLVVASGFPGLVLGVMSIRAMGMRLLPGTGLASLAAVLLAFFAVAAAIAPPQSLVGRDLFVAACGMAGLLLVGMAIGNIRRAHDVSDEGPGP